MVEFAFLDWFWLIAFILLMVGCGVLFYRMGKRSESDFFLAGRGLPWWLPASSVYATHTATDTAMWISGVVYQHGLTGLWYTFFSAWCAISAFVSTKIFRRSLAYTQAEWQSLRFGGMAGELLRGWIAGWQVFLNMFILGWVGIAMGKVCNFLFGWPLWIGLIVFSSVCAVYVLAAGYWGVVMADFQQGIIAFIVILIVSFVAIDGGGGPAGIIDKLADLGASGKLNPFNFSGFFSGDFPAAWFITMLFIGILGGLGMGTVVLLLGSFVFGSIMENITEWLIFALWIMAAGVWLPSILQVIWWRFNGWGYLSAWISNLVLSWLVVWVLPAFGLLPELRDYQQFWLLMLLGLFVYLPVTLLTKPEKMDHLVKFYVMSRPVGFWGPVKREAERLGLPGGDHAVD